MSNSRPAAFTGSGSDDNRPGETVLSVLTGCQTATGTVTPGPKSSESARYATSDISAEAGVVLVIAGSGATFADGCEAENESAGFALPIMASDENAAEARNSFRGIARVRLFLFSDKCNDVLVLLCTEYGIYANVSSQKREENKMDVNINERRWRVGWNLFMLLNSAL